MALIAGNFYQKEYNVLINRYEWRAKPMFAVIVFAPIIWMAATRAWIGDTYNYSQSFLNMPNSFSEIPAYVASITKDKGYYAFVAILKQFIGNSTVRYFLAIALIQGGVLIYTYRKFSCDYVMSIFLFVASVEYISWMFNGIRQFTAVVIIFAATSLMVKRKNLTLIIIVLFASLFHQSAVIMIPLILIAQGEAWNKKSLFFIGLIIIALIYIDRFTAFLNDSLEHTQYTGYLTMNDLAGDDGANPIRALVYSVPAIISFFKRDYIRSKNDSALNICVNMSIATAGIYWMSVFTSGILVARLTGYCCLYNYILLPWEMNYCFEGSNKRLMKIGVISSYLFYYYYQMSVLYNLF